MKNKKVKKNIIITGAYGQDGTILSKIIDKDKYKVIGIVKNFNFKKHLQNVTYQKINLLNRKLVFKKIKNLKPFVLIHFGSENPSFNENKKKEIDFYTKNFEITKNLIDGFAKLKKSKLIIIGSSQMYRENIKKIDLTTKFSQSTPYTKFRIDSFEYMIKQKKKYNSNMVMAILFNHDSIYRNKKFLIPRLIRLIKNRNFKKLQEIFNENISGDFSHADDICAGLLKLMISKKNPDKLIFSSNKRTNINKLINYLLKKNKIKKNLLSKINKKRLLPLGNNLYTKKILNWKIKKNVFFVANKLNNLF
jgi:GDP-D-mannose dehydratase